MCVLGGGGGGQGSGGDYLVRLHGCLVNEVNPCHAEPGYTLPLQTV